MLKPLSCGLLFKRAIFRQVLIRSISLFVQLCPANSTRCEKQTGLLRHDFYFVFPDVGLLVMISFLPAKMMMITSTSVLAWRVWMVTVVAFFPRSELIVKSLRVFPSLSFTMTFAPVTSSQLAQETLTSTDPFAVPGATFVTAASGLASAFAITGSEVRRSMAVTVRFALPLIDTES